MNCGERNLDNLAMASFSDFHFFIRRIFVRLIGGIGLSVRTFPQGIEDERGFGKQNGFNLKRGH